MCINIDFAFKYIFAYNWISTHTRNYFILSISQYGCPIETYPDILLPTGSTARSLQDLHPFFSALSTGEPHPSLNSTISQLEQELELDFLEPIPSR